MNFHAFYDDTISFPGDGDDDDDDDGILNVLNKLFWRSNQTKKNVTFCEFLMACAITAVWRIHVTITIIFTVGFCISSNWEKHHI